ncbi:hypothetical protein [Streptomyces sp. CB02923]|uniref:hypothetical protein n=1 Tax=Streptomyces sp. CB02923 TaxID=1718985 RepID=UPI001900049E|nr:hypothetical protein [Streptomyces sp. CB02923]
MNWLSPIAALLGAVIGAGASLLAQRGQWRQQLQAQDHQARRQLYGQYLAALHEAGERLHLLAAGVKKPDADLFMEAAHEALSSESLYSLRAQLVISAPEPVVKEVRKSLLAMRNLRDCIGRRSLLGSEEHKAAYRAVRETQERLRDLMRADVVGRGR